MVHDSHVADSRSHFHDPSTTFAMTIPLSSATPVIDVSELKKIKNFVIGNPSAKAELAQNEAFIEG